MSKFSFVCQNIESNNIDISENQYNTEDLEKRSRATKNWKKIKEISKKEDKRPPWQMVSLSTLPKADTNSILRAKLLDASRRLRAGKNSVAIQTDMEMIITKLMKEVNTDVQCDLISTQDAEVLTDGAISMRPEGPGEFFLTHSVSQMTDCTIVADESTQTPSPRIPSSFFHQYFSSEAYKLLHEQLKNKSIDKMKENEKNISILDTTSNDDETLNPIYLHKPKTMERKNLFQDTLAYWSYDYFIETILPSQMNSRDNINNNIGIGKKLANMTLTPQPWKKINLKTPIPLLWNDMQCNAVFNLIQEANALLNVFEDISSHLGPDIKLNKLPKRDQTEISYPSKYWNPIFQKSRNLIARKKSLLKKITIRTVEKLNVDAEII